MLSHQKRLKKKENLLKKEEERLLIKQEEADKKFKTLFLSKDPPFFHPNSRPNVKGCGDKTVQKPRKKYTLAIQISSSPLNSHLRELLKGESVKKIFFIQLLLLLSQSAYTMTCREAIVEVYKAYGIDRDPKSFSSYTFEGLGLSVEEYNRLSQIQQQVAYTLLKPMSMSVAETLEIVSKRLSMFNSPFYTRILENDLNPNNDVPEERRARARELKERLDAWKYQKEILENCVYE